MKIVLITGGSRSGKSAYALKLAQQRAGKKAFVATAEALDDEMRCRIDAHKRQRDSAWETFEEPLAVSETITGLAGKYDVILVDCLTLWLSNLLMKEPEKAERQCGDFISTLNQMKTAQPPETSLYLVTNEVGMSIVPENRLARLFRDAAGTLNQQAAALSDEVYLVVSGLPLKLK
ncbi:MAG: bifunctional adenosylcobinamide kinase/adenosylcobinamide-phosphate guanylyltransferase [Candidatus Magnetominusculus sp. LBB02]|nr:bifunctional adenosylcobinamide kinase/adenosylcobinamide-phosphate guanylyltransferase [Candidatus Magnetominusculus sp. LBB02]